MGFKVWTATVAGIAVLAGVANPVGSAEPSGFQTLEPPSTVDQEQGEISEGPHQELGSTPPHLEIPLPHEMVTDEDGNVMYAPPLIVEFVATASDIDEAAVTERVLEIESELAQHRRTAPRAAIDDLIPHGAQTQPGFIARYVNSSSVYAVPMDVRAVVDRALNDWAGALESPVPIVVDVAWQCFDNPSVLGYASATTMIQSGALPTGYSYPVALANALSGRDLNGNDAEVSIVLNAELARFSPCDYATNTWYMGTGTIPAGQIDLTAVVRHEVAHGLGFLGSAWQDYAGAPPSLSNPPYRYDSFVHTVNGRLLDQPRPNGYLTSPLSFDIGGGVTYQLFSPPAFVLGSSYSHFDPAATTGDRGGALMTPGLNAGPTPSTIDAAVLGVLQQQGWQIRPAPITPRLELVSGSHSAIVRIRPPMNQFGAPPTQYRITAVRDGIVDAEITVPARQQDLTLRPLFNGVSYTIRVTAIDRQGRHSAPAAGTATMPALPNQPQRVAVSGSGSTRTVTWAAGVGAQPSDSYRVERRLVGGPWQHVGDTASLQLSTGSLAKGVYQFRVFSVRSGSRSPAALSLLTGISPGVIRPLPLDGAVGRLFRAYFLRDPDPSGFSYWLDQTARGLPVAVVSNEFAVSPEFIQRYGQLSDTDFVHRVYRNVFDRPADPAGHSYWLTQIRRGLPRGDVMLNFAQSPEYIAATGTAAPTTSVEGKVSRLYMSVFLREPDPSGLRYWTGEANRGLSLNAIADELVRSEEFEQMYGSLPDDRFIELVYNNVLSRVPDPDGKQHWVRELQRHRSRGSVMTGFSESVEFILRTGTIP